jgi:hypothetical protein
MELPDTCGMLGYYITLTPSIMLSNFPLPIFLIYYGKNTITSNATPSPPSGLVFNIAQYPSKGRVLTSSTLNCDMVLDLLDYF